MKVELNARNIVNTDKIDEYIENIILFNSNDDRENPDWDSEDEYFEQLHNWLRSNLKNYIQNRYEGVEKIKKYKKDDPDWLKKGVDEGTALRIDLSSKDLKRKINHIIDYFESMEEKEIGKIHRLTFEVAVKKSEEWTRKLQKNVPKDIDASGEAVVRKYAGGITWKRLLTKEALQREGSKPRMDHCVGGDHFIKKLEKNKAEFYSLRDSSDHPQCTIEVERNNIEQMKGFNDGPVKREFCKYCEDFIEKPFNRTHYSIVKDSELIGLIEQDGEWINLYALPDNLTIKDGLDLSGLDITSLPKGLTIKGSLSLSKSKITSLPNDLKIEGNLSLRGCTELKSLPKELRFVVRYLDLSSSSIISLPDKLITTGSLNLGNTKLTYLPDDLEVGANLNIRKTNITVLPKNLKVKGAIFVDKTFSTKNYPMFKFEKGEATFKKY